MTDKNPIHAALLRLDPDNDDHWTSEGKPRVEAVQAVLSEDPLYEGALKRKDLDEAAPGFDRASLSEAENVEAEAEVEDAAEAEVEDAEPKEDTEAVRARYNERLSELNEARAQREVEKSALTRAIAELDSEIERVTDAMNREVGPISFAEAHRDYVRASIASRQARVGRVSAINEFAGQNTGITPKAPIDAAFARNRRRGGARPIRAPLRG